MMLKSSSYKQPTDSINHSFHIQQSYELCTNNQSLLKPFQQSNNLSQPELQSQQLFFKASLQFIRKKKIDNYYLFNDDLIGQGSFAKVYKGINILTNEIVAIKVMQIKHIMENKLYALVEAQMQIIKSLKHPNVLRCYDILITDNNCYIVTQYCDDGELKQFINKQMITNESHDIENSMINLLTLQPLIYDIYQGLLYLQRKKVIHRDIKMSNILVKNGKAKIADFGLAAFSKYDQIFQDVKVGSPVYMSPQAFLGSLYGPKTDVWAFGILIFQFFHGKTPFENCRSTQQLEKKISQVFDKSMITAGISQDTKKLICMCLSYDWQERPSFKQLWGEGYIKSLRLKSYVSEKGLKNYKQTLMSSLRRQVQKSKEEKKINNVMQSCKSENILRIDRDVKIENKVSQKSQDDTKQQNEQQKYQGYSFEDFLKMNSQQENNFLNDVGNSKSKQKIQCQSVTIDKTLNNLYVADNGIKSNNGGFEDEMQKFYRQAQKMMIQQNNIQTSTQNQQLNLLNQKGQQNKSQAYKSQALVEQQEIKDDQTAKINTLTSAQKHHFSEQTISISILQKDPSINKFNKIGSNGDQANKFTYFINKTRKINLNKNYCSQITEKKQNDSLKNSTEIKTQQNFTNNQNSKQNKKSQIIPQYQSQCQKITYVLNLQLRQQQECPISKNSILIKQSIPSQSNQKSQKKKQTKNNSPVQMKKNLYDSVHIQNLKKFSHLLKKQQFNKNIDMKPKQTILEKKSKSKKQTYNIDLVLVLLEFIRFIVKFIKSMKKIRDCFQAQNILYFQNLSKIDNNEFNSIKINKAYQEYFQFEGKFSILSQKFSSFSQQVLMKKVSQITFTLDTQKSSQLFEIVKTHKILLNGLKIQNKKFQINISNQNQFFQEIFLTVKQIEDLLTIFMEKELQNNHSQKLYLINWRICWLGSWLSKIYDAFLQLQEHINPTKKSKSLNLKNQQSQDLKSILKQLEQFVESYQRVQGYLKIQNNGKSEIELTEIRTDEVQKMKNDINYFFQLVYEIQLRKMNSVSF